MSMSRYPDQDHEPTSSAPIGRTKVIIAVIVVLLAGIIALHLAGVFGH
jgi:hypothetical protein